MKNVLYKSFRDFKKLIVPFLVSIVLATPFISRISDYIQGEKIPLSDITYWLLVFGAIAIFIFTIIIIVNSVLYVIVYGNIKISPIQSSKNRNGKLLLHIVNNVDDDMTNVKIEFKKLLVDKSGKSESIIGIDNNFFKIGMINEDGNTVFANSSSKVEIAEDDNGLLRILTDDEYVSDALLGMPEFEKHQSYRFLINVKAKVGDVFFNKDVEVPFNHWIDENQIETSGDEKSKIERHPSYLKWAISQS